MAERMSRISDERNTRRPSRDGFVSWCGFLAVLLYFSAIGWYFRVGVVLSSPGLDAGLANLIAEVPFLIGTACLVAATVLHGLARAMLRLNALRAELVTLRRDRG